MWERSPRTSDAIIESICNSSYMNHNRFCFWIQTITKESHRIIMDWHIHHDEPRLLLCAYNIGSGSRLNGSGVASSSDHPNRNKPYPPKTDTSLSTTAKSTTVRPTCLTSGTASSNSSPKFSPTSASKRATSWMMAPPPRRKRCAIHAHGAGFMLTAGRHLSNT